MEQMVNSIQEKIQKIAAIYEHNGDSSGDEEEKREIPDRT
jgi:hypothetical protein